MKKILAAMFALTLVLALAACAAVAPGDSDPTLEPATQEQQGQVPPQQANVLEALPVQDTRPMVLNFWASWCPACTRMMPALQAAYEQFGEDVVFVAVNLIGGRESHASAMALIERHGYSFPVYFDHDSQLRREHSVSSLPTTVFINSQGEAVHRQIGTMNERALFAQIESLS